ncbi:hypothetical protein B0W31_24130 [Salmonella enterica subsp. enterica serovar Typhimurium]|nr:hypothetical protein [Salmonella enterica subsp. enterica serovar Typhimurium]
MRFLRSVLCEMARNALACISMHTVKTFPAVIPGFSGWFVAVFTGYAPGSRRPVRRWCAQEMLW